MFLFNWLFRKCLALVCHFRNLWWRITYSNLTIGRSPQISLSASLIITDGGRIRLGNNVCIKPGVKLIAKGGELSIGDNAFIGWDSLIAASEKVHIGENALIAERVSIRDQNHGTNPGRPYCQQPVNAAPISIDGNVWLGANVVVLKGVEIPANTVVGANAVVVKTLPEAAVYGGVPAKRISSLQKEEAD